jgi:hypothetical protein
MNGWEGMTDRQRMEQLATDGRRHEWSWYQDDVPRLLAILDALEHALHTQSAVLSVAQAEVQVARNLWRELSLGSVWLDDEQDEHDR